MCPAESSLTLSVDALVGLLLRLGGPAAVLWRVRPVVVHAVDRVFAGRPTSHVCQEGLVRVSPRLAHGDSASPVILEASVLGVRASLEHASPRLKLRRPSAPNRLAVRGLGGAALLLVVAAAAVGEAAIQPRSHQHPLGAAIAAAQPVLAAPGAICSREHRPSPETLPSLQVQSPCCHGLLSAFASGAATAPDARSFRSKFSTASNALPTAVALTEPVCAGPRIVNWAKDKESVNSLPGQVGWFHSTIITGVQGVTIS